MNRNLIIGIGIAVAIVLAGTAAWYFLNPTPGVAPVTPDTILISLPASESSALVYIAQDRHFFSGNGLDVIVRIYEPPAAGVKGMLKGEVDLAGASEYAVVLNAFSRENISIIVRADEIQSVYLIGRKDRGIATFSDLKGKKIGIPLGTNAEFYLGRFLTLHGLNLTDVTLVNVQPQKFAETIESGDIDAIICWQPYVSGIRNRMGDGIVAWPAQGGQPTYGVIVARNEWIARNPEITVRFLKSLDMAAEYVATHPAESRSIVRKRVNMSDAYLDVMWPENHFSLLLDQSLILAMEDEARWMIANNLTNVTVVPDFRDYIYTEGLEEVRPGSVNIIG